MVEKAFYYDELTDQKMADSPAKGLSCQQAEYGAVYLKK